MSSKGDGKKRLTSALVGTHFPNKLPFRQSLKCTSKSPHPRGCLFPHSLPLKILFTKLFHCKKDAKNAKVFFSSLCFFLTFSISIVGLMVGAYRLGGVRLMCTRRGMGIWAARNSNSSGAIHSHAKIYPRKTKTHTTYPTGFKRSIYKGLKLLHFQV